MANPGGAGTKFVSVNLNKSYGPVSNRNPSFNNNNNSSNNGQAAVGRGRGGGGMVVLSRSKTSLQKPGPKLSVPPPLNLPSLRKENQRFDPSVPAGGSSAGGAGLSGAARPTSSGLGWTKPVTALQDLSNDSVSVNKFDQNVGLIDGFTRVGSAYMPPSARLGSGGLPPQLPPHQLDKAAVLRGEDFPSLRAALPSGTASGSTQKKEVTHHQKQKQMLSDESANEHLNHHHSNNGNGSNENFGEGYGSGNMTLTSQARKAEDFFSGPLPLVRLNPRSDWADDERDTGHVFVDRSKDYGYSNNEAYWDRDFDMPKSRVLPHKPADNQFPRWGKREDESVRNTISEVPKMDSFVKAPSRDGNSWRAMDLNRENGKDDKYVPPRVGEYSRVSVTVNQNNRVNDRNTRDFYGNEQSNRFKGYGLQNSSIPKSTFSPSGKGFSVNDSVPNFGHEKRAFSIGERTKPVDTFLSPESFDEHDPFSSALVGVIKRKKDVKQADFHDPVRESFEAELERVQKMQEQERRRISEEQERALEKARREVEERERLIREEEEHRRRVEEAAREAAWREERERLEAIRRAEEQKIAREEERRKMNMEEERRKQAAKQKLLELEAKMAKRNSSTATSNNNKGTTSLVEKDTSRVADFESWEDSERMVDRIMTPGSSDSSGPNRSFEPGHRSQPVNPWRRDVLESGNNSSFIDHDNGHYSPRRDGPIGGRSFTKKVGPYYSGRKEENYAEDYPYNRSMDTYPEFHDNVQGKYGDGGWGQGRFQGNAHPPYPERLNSDGDELYPYGRSRYSMKQPRVLPPPSLVPMQKNERPGPSGFTRYNSSSGNESNMQMGYYIGSQETVEASEIADVAQQNNMAQKLTDKDSHSSLSVSSPPDSLAHFSHDDLDESGNSPNESATEGKPVVSDTKSPKDTIMTGSGLTSDADEDWSIENNEKLQEQEEYDEDEDGYQVEDEVHEGDDDNIALNQEFDDLHIAEKDSPDMMENLVLGFDDGVEVRLPSGYGERSSSNEESAFIDQEKTVDGKQGEIPTNTDPHTVAAREETVDRSSINISSHFSAGQTVMSTVPVGSSPTDMPFKLQFGLFTGPPLIPSPIPAIQIGSIQMPLHIHPSVNHSLTQVHQSQAPLFQFGKLRFTTPISQGIVPIAPQMSFVQPNVQVGYNLNQNSVGQMHIHSKQEGVVNNFIKTDIASSSMGGGSNVVQRKVAEVAKPNENNYMPDLGQENYRQANGTVSKGMHHSEDSRGLRAHGQQSGFKSKRFAYVARNSNVRSAFPVPETSRSNSGGFQRRPRRTAQRTEFRVRENADSRPGFTARNVGVFVRSGPKKGSMANNSAGQMVELEPSSSVQQTNINIDKESSSTAENNNPQSVERSLKMNLDYDEDVDAPLQSGIVRVFKQPGIEAPSDEDDFIQVRSKRQMLNDRREQREKEIKAKSRVTKAPRRIGYIAPSSVISRSNTKSAIGGELAKHTESNVVLEGRGLTNIESSKVYTSAALQPLAPIGPPAVTSDLQADKRPQIIKSLQTGASSAISDGGNDLGSGLMFETKNNILNDVQTSLGSWGNSHINQQVMALTQTQLDEAMRPDRFDEHVTSTNGHSNSVVNPNMTSSSTLAKDKLFSSSASPVNSLLAGEKIQFGAVTSPTVLPPSSRAVSHVIRAPVSSRSEKLISHSLSSSESDCTMIFEKEKNQGEPRDHLEDAEAEAEAAASAVAVAAISNDESISVSDADGFRCADINGVTGGMASNQQLSSQSRAEESLSVALPADLSVETPISSWPPLPSPKGSSGQMLSHFPGGPSSPFPFYEMGPMMRGPIFAFGPHDESGGTQSQAQKSSVAGSGPLGPWQQFHSGPDSFYGPPAGFPGPYMGPHGGIPAVQGPPHMVVYNHFPVGQFGQVGLSFMGTTYIPSGKQPDWKHNHSNREGDINNMNMGSGQHINTSGMASPVQHLAPSSQLLPMPSPLALFDVSQFQSAPDASVHGGWPHATSSSLHSAPLSNSMPHQQHETGVLNYSQISNRFSEPRTSIPSTDSASTPFPDDLGLVNPSSSNVVGSSIQTSTISHTAKTDGAQSGGNNNNINTGHCNNTYKTRAPQPRNMPSQHQYNHHSMGYGYQKNRMGYNHGRNNTTVMDKGFPSKVKQIYVPKQTTNSGSTVG